MNIAVTGHQGYLGSYLVDKHKCLPVKADILDTIALEYLYGNEDIDLLIHCAAMTDVDECEKNPDQAFRVNTVGTMNVINVFHCPIIYLSTDHVFNGKSKLWSPNEKTKTDPVNMYGMTKYAGEVMALTSTHPVLVVRSSKLFDYSTLKNDLQALLGRKEREFTGLIHRNFTHRNHFADILIQLALSDWTKFKGNILHLSAPVSYSYAEFWKLVASEFEIDTDLVVERKYPLDNAVSRPFRGGLDSRKISKIFRLPSTIDGIKLVKKEFYEKEM